MRPDELSRAVVDGLGAIVWEATPGREPGHAHFSFVSDGTVDLLGYPPERWTEDPTFWLSTCREDHRDAAIAHIVRAARDGAPADFEFVARHAAGHELWLRNIVRTRPGRPPRLSGVVVDVTQRKRAEERLSRVHAVTMRLAGLLDPQEIARTVAAEGRSAIGAVSLAVHVRRGDEIELLASEGPDPVAEDGATHELPLVAEERDLGSLVVRMPTERDFAPVDRVVLDVLATACAQAILLSQALGTEQRASALLDLLIDKAPDGWALFDRELRYVRVNEALARINGIPPDAHIGRTLADIVPDIPNHGHLEPLRRVLETGEPIEVEVSGRTAADPAREHTWIASYYPVRRPGGEIEAVGALVSDITARKRAEERAALLAALGPILEEPVGVEQRLERLAHALVGRVGDLATVTLQDGEERERVASAHVDPSRERVLAMLLPTDVSALGEATVVVDDATEEELRAVTRDEQHLEAIQRVGYRSAVIVPMSVRGRRVGTLAVGSLRPHAFGEEEVALIEEVATRAALSVDNARLYESERAARERTVRLQAITAALSEALTPGDVARTVLATVTPGLGAHMGGVWELDADRQALVPLAQHGYPDPDLAGWRHLPLSQPLPITDALRAGRTLYLPTLEARIERWPHLERDFRSVGTGSLAIVPLFARGEAVGVISLSLRRPRALEEADLGFLEAIGSQCAQALERARLYEAERQIAATLQRSLLPQRLPTVEGVEFAVRYLPAAGLAAGGDFYEAIDLPGGAIGVAVGDVVGRGSNAAAAMGQLRSALRAFALAGAGPAEVLTQLSNFADTVEGALAATAAYAVIDPAAGEVRYACAGHPYPVLAGADGHTRFLTEGRSLPLACAPEPGYQEASVPLRPGDTMLLFTDGLTERRGVGMDESMERLRTSLAERATLPLSALLDSVVAAQGADEPLDDVALLAVRLAGPQAPVHHLRTPALPEHVAAARSHLRAWLADADVPPAVAADVLLACGEALANAAEHAYRDRPADHLELVVRCGPSVIEIEVRDGGSWKHEGGSADRGRGFELMRALMHSVDVERTEGGTVVRMLRRRGDAPPAGPAPDGLAPREPAPAAVHVQGDVVHVSGDLDLASVPGVLAQLDDGPSLALDLAEVGYLDSAGARLLVELADRFALTVHAPAGSAARRAIETAGLDARVGLRP